MFDSALDVFDAVVSRESIPGIMLDTKVRDKVIEYCNRLFER